MDVAHPVHVLLEHGEGVLPGEGEVARVVAEEHVAGVGVGHHPIGLRGGLDHGAHVVMEAKLEAPLHGRLAESVQAFTEAIPLPVVHDVLVVAGQDGGVHLALDGIALLGHVDPVGAHGGEEVQLPVEIRQVFLQRFGQQKGGEPAAGDPHAPQVQLPLQFLGVLGVFVPDLAAGEPGKGHLADGLPEGVLRPQLRHVVVAPADGRDAQLHFLRVKQCHVFAPFRSWRRRFCAPPPPQPPPPRDRPACRMLSG